MLFLLAGLTLFLGFYPNLILDTIDVSVDKLINDYQMNLILNTVK
jgi:NADH:ubiquinone oxidoreductase subunit 4 (subunit M)